MARPPFPPRAAPPRRPVAAGGGNILWDISALSLAGKLDLLAVAVLVAGYCLQMSVTTNMFLPGAMQIGMALGYSVLIIYIGISVVRGRWLGAAAVSLYLLFLIWQVYHFHLVAGAPLKPLVVLSFFGPIALAFVFQVARVPLRVLLAVLLIGCVLYTLYYIASEPIVSSYRGFEAAAGVLASDGERAQRAYLASQLTAFVLFYGIASIRRRPLVAVLLIVIAGYALYLSQSRFVQAVILIVAAMAIVNMMVPMTRRWTAWTLTAVLVTLSLWSLYGYIDAGMNPDEPFLADASGRARYLQFIDAQPIVIRHFWLGVGLPTSVDDLQYFVRPRQPFFYTDLGVAGIAFVFGVPLTVLILAAMCATMVAIPNRDLATQPLVMALFWTNQSGVFGTFFNFAAIFSGGLFLGLMLVLWMRGDALDPVFRRRPEQLRLTSRRGAEA